MPPRPDKIDAARATLRKVLIFTKTPKVLSYNGVAVRFPRVCRGFWGRKPGSVARADKNSLQRGLSSNHRRVGDKRAYGIAFGQTPEKGINRPQARSDD